MIMGTLSFANTKFFLFIEGKKKKKEKKRKKGLTFWCFFHKVGRSFLVIPERAFKTLYILFNADAKISV